MPPEELCEPPLPPELCEPPLPPFVPPDDEPAWPPLPAVVLPGDEPFEQARASATTGRMRVSVWDGTPGAFGSRRRCLKHNICRLHRAAYGTASSNATA